MSSFAPLTCKDHDLWMFCFVFFFCLGGVGVAGWFNFCTAAGAAADALPEKASLTQLSPAAAFGPKKTSFET